MNGYGLRDYGYGSYYMIAMDMNKLDLSMDMVPVDMIVMNMDIPFMDMDMPIKVLNITKRRDIQP